MSVIYTCAIRRGFGSCLVPQIHCRVHGNRVPVLGQGPLPFCIGAPPIKLFDDLRRLLFLCTAQALLLEAALRKRLGIQVDVCVFLAWLSLLALTAEGGRPPALLSSGPKVELSSPLPLGMYQTDTDEFQGK